MNKLILAIALSGAAASGFAGVCHVEANVTSAIIHSVEPGKQCNPGDTLHISGKYALASRAAAMACKPGTVSGPIGNRPEIMGHVCEFNGAPIRYDFYIRLRMGTIDEKGNVTANPE